MQKVENIACFDFKFLRQISIFTSWYLFLSRGAHIFGILLLNVGISPFILAVVYLDADTIVVKSIEDLFKCGKFCANLKHSERLNSGVMVIEPSDEVFKDMMSKVTTLPSYTGGMVFLLTVQF